LRELRAEAVVSALVRAARLLVDVARLTAVSVPYALTERREYLDPVSDAALLVLLHGWRRDVDSVPYPDIEPPSLEEMANCREAAESQLRRASA
jgi:hypothetical protein